MIELGRFAREQAQRFPKKHPERSALERMAQVAENWARHNGTAEKPALTPTEKKKETSAHPEINLEAEWQRQASKYIRFGFHRALNLTEEDYLASLPRFEPQPEEYRDRFNVPLLVETRIPWEKQAQLASIAISDYQRSRINETKPYNARSKTPDTPYTGWFNKWGERFTQKITPLDARKQLAADEIGGGPYEGIAMQIAHPEITRSGKYLDLIGYNVESGRVSSLYRWGGEPRLGAIWGGFARGDFRPLVRGSRIVTG